jgi:excisionase family DNA binding protein
MWKEARMKALLWPGEVAQALGLSAKTINRMADAGMIEAIRDIRGRRRYRPETIETLRVKLGLTVEPASDGPDAAAVGD